ncbi:uncharacterized protein EI90DRAFT_3149529 [Cantharellus anzutake]|uniref:uncharacterized protein n=1 Tax=Cantharellus anzutake TaxID=1750568 RepID=UPI001908571F|nr:uncharacterized protein EI90DRAFT_3149529 [Cantharellus anzutake]KAF8344097.1 hypothetical protein EI90DRAFT_3149529 [Cantharellus anzutake]
MSLQQEAETLRQKTDDLLAAGGNLAVLTLRGVNATADWCPPLKRATGAALFIFDDVKKFKENAKEWTDFGEYVASAMAKVSSAIKSDDVSAEEAKPWVESATKLDGALQKIKSEIEGREKVEKRSAIRKTFFYWRDPGRIDGLKKDLDKALASFQLSTNLITGSKLAAIERGLHDDKILDNLRYLHLAHDDSPQVCLKDTRVDLIERIMTWCRNTGDSENRLMLLTAVAGAGKTSIALTIAERCASEGDVTLLLQFFFKAGERSRPDFLFSGMARALADHDPVYRTFITSALQNDPSLATASFTTQFKKLVAPSLLHKPPPSNRPMVIIIDALDECDKEAFESLAEILGEEVPRLPSSIKFFITSRQFDLVNRYLSPNYPIDRLTIDLSDEANAQDCARFIRFQLQKLKMLHRDLQRNLQDEDKMVQEISERANGLFIWISTIFRYMKTTNQNPMRTLKNLYTSILKKCAWEDEDFAHDYPIVMGAIFVAQQPLSITAWDSILLPFLKSSVRYALAELAPLLSGVEDSLIPVRILHQSFRDFIVDRIDPQSVSSRCAPIAVGADNARVALRCTEILNEGLCSVEGLGLIENLYEKDEMPHIPQKELSEHFRYACRHIVHHLSGVEEPSEELAGLVSMFLGQQATRWVEVCVRMESYVRISLLPEWAKLAVVHKSEDAVSTLANVLARLHLNLGFFSRFQEAYEAANDSVVLCRYLFSVDSSSYTLDLATSLNNLYNALSDLGRHSEALPFIEESVILYRQLVAINPGSYTLDLARSLNNLYNALSDLGRHSEALPFIEESIILYRHLVAINPGSYTPDLAMSLNNLHNALSYLGRHSEALPFIEESVNLRRQLVAINPGSYTPDLARSLNNLYNAHSYLGRHSEALGFIKESIKLRRQLVAVNPGSYTPDLANSLNNLYNALSDLGRHSEALPFIEESVKLRRQLVAVYPGSYTPDLAMSLNNLHNALSYLGRHSEALPFIEESVKLYRQLVAINPGSYTPDLAMSLNNLHNALSYLGRHSEALPFIEESVKLRRQLVAVYPGSYTPDLAMSLNNLHNALSYLGRHSEALPFIEESVKLYRQLVAINPGSYTPDLAMSLNNLHNALSYLGRHSEALPFIEESVNLRRQLVAINPGSYTPDLARSLNNLYNAHSYLGRHSEALGFIKESIKLRRQLVAVNPGSYTPDLASSLNNLYNALSDLGWHSEALPFIEESVKLYRQLVVVNPGAYTPDLANSLNNLRNAHSYLGRHSEALPFIEESVKLRRQLVAVNPGSHTPDLASSLNNLCNALSDLGRHSEALPFIEESVKLYRQLVAINPGSYTPDLARSLNNLYNALSYLGRHSEALPFIEESVNLRRQLVAVNPGSYAPGLAMSLNDLRNALSNLGQHSEALPFIKECVKMQHQLGLPSIPELSDLKTEFLPPPPTDSSMDLFLDSHNLDGQISFDWSVNEVESTGEGMYQGGRVRIETLHEIDLLDRAMLDSFVKASHVRHQLAILRELSHPNVVRFRGWISDLVGGSLLRASIAFTGCSGGNILPYLHVQGNANRHNLVLDISRGLEFIHSRKIVHGNLNPSKIYVNESNGDPFAQISGFEYSYILTNAQTNSGMEGMRPIRYSAPEVLRPDAVLWDQKSDIWSFGCTSLEILRGERPYSTILNDWYIPLLAPEHGSPYAWRDPGKFEWVLHDCLKRDPDGWDSAERIMLKLQAAEDAKSPYSDLRHELLQQDERDLTEKIKFEDTLDFQTDSGAIYKGSYDGKYVGIKEIRVSDADSIKSLKRQIRLWSGLLHPNLVSFHGWAMINKEDTWRVNFISTWCGGGNIRTYLRNYPHANKHDLVLDIALGLSYLHSEEIVHGDIKPENIWIGNRGRAYLSGFEFSYHVNSGGIPLQILRNNPTFVFGLPSYWLTSSKFPTRRATSGLLGVFLLRFFSAGNRIRRLATRSSCPLWHAFNRLMNGAILTRLWVS